MKIELNPRQKEIFEFDVALAGVARHDLAMFRLMMIFDEFQIAVQGKYNNGIATFMIPALQNYIEGIKTKETLPFYIEFAYEEYTSRIYENEFEIVILPEASIEKITHLKQEVEEERQPVKIDKKIIVKESTPFSQGFTAFCKEKE